MQGGLCVFKEDVRMVGRLVEIEESQVKAMVSGSKRASGGQPVRGGRGAGCVEFPVESGGQEDRDAGNQQCAAAVSTMESSSASRLVSEFRPRPKSTSALR